MERIFTSSGIEVPRQSLTWAFTRSGGAGGQHVNTSSTRVELNCEIGRLIADQEVIDALLRRFGPRIRVTESTRRSQFQNRQVALARLLVYLDSESRIRVDRRLTRPTTSSKLRRRKQKMLVSRRKAERRTGGFDD